MLVCQIDIKQGKAIKSWNAHSGKVYNIHMANDGKSAFTIDSDNTVSILANSCTDWFLSILIAMLIGSSAF